MTLPAAHRDLAMLRARFGAQRSQAVAAFRRHLDPETLLATLCHIADQILLELLARYPAPARACLAAVGGYGRGELYPHSDLDLLILLAQAPDARDRQAIEALVAALWDVGFEPGIRVATLAQCRDEADADITIQTALLEARHLAGNPALFETFRQQMQDDLDGPAFFLAKQSEMRQRHARYQDTPYALEPNCKESPGGLRDLQVLLWLARAAGFGDTWQAVVRAQRLTTTEFRSLRRAERAFKRLRIELHLLARRREDRVLFEFQPALAAIYGFRDQPVRRASELLMQRYYWAARVVCQLNHLLMQALEEHLFPQPDEPVLPIDDHFCQVRGRLQLIRTDDFERHPTLLFAAFLVLQQHPGLRGMAASTLRALWHARRRVGASFRHDPENRALFLEILQQPHGVTRTLRAMTMWNILPRYLPPFRRIVGQMQHDLFHAYTVDQHLLMVIRNLRRFGLPEHAHEYPLASRLMAETDQPWLLYVAALFHDIAKGRGGDHSTLGALEVRRFARHHGLSAPDAQLVEFLVREHLTMSRVAQKRDLSDPHTIREFAALVGSQQRLIALYLLTVADIRATGPGIWNAWKGKLLEDLYHLSTAAIGGSRTDTGTILAMRKQAALALARETGATTEEVAAFWAQLDTVYFLRHDAGEMGWHAAVLSPRFRAGGNVVRVRVLEQAQALQVLVHAADRPDLFMRLCECFEAGGFSIQDARIHTTRQGQALDGFVVLPPDQDTDLPCQARQLERALHAALVRPTGSGAPDPRGSGRRNSSRAQIFPIPPTVHLAMDDHQPSWRLSITAMDRVGLLRDLARVFVQYGVNLHMAKIMTLGDRVEDTFSLDGEALGRHRSQMRFERAILAVLRPEDRAMPPRAAPLCTTDSGN